MARYYIYLLSSLPMLHFGSRPPFSFEKLAGMCRGLIPDEDLDIIKSITLDQAHAYKGGQATLNRWRIFDIALRNELAKIRASRKHIDPHKYLRESPSPDIYINHLAINAARNPSILEGERMLDEARWRVLDEFSAGHYFDLDLLIVYAIKLLMLGKWERVAASDKSRLLEEVTAKG